MQALLHFWQASRIELKVTIAGAAADPGCKAEARGCQGGQRQAVFASAFCWTRQSSHASEQREAAPCRLPRSDLQACILGAKQRQQSSSPPLFSGTREAGWEGEQCWRQGAQRRCGGGSALHGSFGRGCPREIAAADEAAASRQHRAGSAQSSLPARWGSMSNVTIT